MCAENCFASVEDVSAKKREESRSGEEQSNNPEVLNRGQTGYSDKGLAREAPRILETAGEKRSQKCLGNSITRQAAGVSQSFVPAAINVRCDG